MGHVDPVMTDCLGIDVSQGLMTDMNNRAGKNIFIGKTEQMTNSSSPSQVQVHQFNEQT
jgi:hypothetical protein